MNRADVYKLIDGERAYQDAQWPENEGPQPLTIGEEILLIEEYLARARAQWAGERRPEMQAMSVLRKIAGIAVRAMENHGASSR
jgi:hypothetical protein